MKTDELREKYLAFFESKGHSRQPSDVLVPTWDPSVLFTPAGMNQFKDHFLGKVKLDFTRATTCQKCLRTGDIDNVGRTAYHHTFFEMLGNFSFGDYFKEEAIHWAWEFLTGAKWLGIPADRLTVTVYKDDDEAAAIWNEKIGLATSRISRMEEDENFWPASAPSLGPDGVCGPCSEIYYQLENGKDVEIWNLVFTQFNRVGLPPDNLRPLPSKNIDTGMGLERTASVLQNVPTNFHIDSLLPIVRAAAEACSTKYEYESDNGRRLRRITDHVRACSFAIHENILPGPKKARYVIKRLLRRAVLDGHQMGLREPFLFQLVPTVAATMGHAYPELRETIDRVSDVIKKEESDFFSTIDAGLERIEGVFDSMRSDGSVMVDGAEAANLYQTYGVPPELFQALAAEHKLTFDWDGYHEATKKHEDISNAGGQNLLFQTGPIETLKEALRRTEFVGYDTTSCSAQVKGIVCSDEAGDDRLLSELDASDCEGNMVRVVLDQSPFYGESGGQVGDSGSIESPEFSFVVEDTQKAGELIIHIGKLTRGQISEGVSVTAQVDVERRDGIRRAHSATHILHHALQSTVGGHAQQQGSKVDADWLRFDFTNQKALTDEEIQQIESIVAEKVQLAAPIAWNTLPLAEARKAGAMMLFGEKYPDPVRMVSMGEFSKELCGGTHLTNTSQVEQFEIVVEESVASGTRRVVAFTGKRADAHRGEVEQLLQGSAALLGCKLNEVAAKTTELGNSIRLLKKQLAGGGASAPLPTPKAASGEQYADQRAVLRDAARNLNVAPGEIASRIQALQEEFTKLTEQVKNLESSGKVSAETLMESAIKSKDTAVIVAETPGATPNLMRQWIDQIRQKSKEPTAILFASKVGDDKVLLVAGVSKALVERGVSAGAWISKVAPVVGGGGGGKPDLAQAGGKNPEKISEAMETAKQTIVELL